MTTLREKLATLDTDAALRLVSNVRPGLFNKVTQLRKLHLKGASELSDRTKDGYAADARRVAASGGNVLALAGTYASFRKLRAACFWRAREDLRECLARADRARKKGGTGDIEALCIYDEALTEIENRIATLGSLRFDAIAATRRNKTHMQRHKLCRLPVNWIAQIHHRTKESKYGDAVAVGILIPVRPDEIANRILIRLDASNALVFEVVGSKSRERGAGIASDVVGIGQPKRWLTLSAVDPTRQDVFEWLRSRVVANGGSMTIGKGLSASGICSAFRAMSKRLFARHRSPPSFYALRHAACAELKAADLDSFEIAKGMGHSSTLSQKVYGIRSQGVGGYKICVSASARVRISNCKNLPPSVTRNVSKSEGTRSIANSFKGLGC